MANKTLSVFIDESGDFGKYNPKSPYYYVSMVLHAQSVDISSEIDSLEHRVTNFGFPNHAIECEDNELSYIAKISRAISDELKNHIDFFNSYDLIINYYDYGQSNLTKIITSVFTALFNNVELRKVQPADYKFFQVADLICTMELTKDKADKNSLSHSEIEFFGSARDFKKNIYKQIAKKKLNK